MIHPTEALLRSAARRDAQVGIREAHAAECAARKKFWIGGAPTQRDLHAVTICIAKRLKTTPEAVQAALDQPNQPLSPKDN